MAGPRRRWLSRIAALFVALVVVTALELQWTLSSARFWSWLPQQWDDRHIISIAIDVALVLVAAIWWLWWRLPQRQVARLSLKIRDPKDRAGCRRQPPQDHRSGARRRRRTDRRDVGLSAVHPAAAGVPRSPDQQPSVERLRAARQRQDHHAAWRSLRGRRRAAVERIRRLVKRRTRR